MPSYEGFKFCICEMFIGAFVISVFWKRFISAIISNSEGFKFCVCEMCIVAFIPLVLGESLWLGNHVELWRFFKCYLHKMCLIALIIFCGWKSSYFNSVPCCIYRFGTWDISQLGKHINYAHISQFHVCHNAEHPCLFFTIFKSQCYSFSRFMFAWYNS